MSRRKDGGLSAKPGRAEHRDNQNGYMAVPGTGVRFRAGGGGTMRALTYDGAPFPRLGALPPKPEVVVHAVPTVPESAA